MDAKVLSCEVKKWEDRVYYSLCLLANGNVGFVNSSVAYKPDSIVQLGLSTNKDHKFIVRVLNG